MLKNSLSARFDPRSGTKHAVLVGISSPIYDRNRLNGEFFNTLAS